MLKIKLFMTMKCNLCCTYCYEQKAANPSTINANLSFYNISDLRKLIQSRLYELNDSEVLIDFFGGEPLLEFTKIKEIIKELTLLPQHIIVNYSITTNGTLITEEIACFFYAHSFKIYLSLDGNEYSCSNRIYKNGDNAFPDIINGLKTLQKFNNNITINIVVNSNNYLNLIENLYFLMEQCVFSFAIAIDFFDTEWLNISNNILSDFYLKIKNFCLSHPNIYVDLFEKETFPLTQCTLGETLSILPNGEVFPCTYFPTCRNNKDLTLGNVSQELNWKLLKEISKEITCDNKQCPSYNYNCNIGCYGKNIICTGNPYTPSPIICKHLACSIESISNYKFLKMRKKQQSIKVV